MNKVASNSPNYRKFVKDRDKALDFILNKYQRKLSAIVAKLEDDTITQCLGTYARNSMVTKETVELKLRPLFREATNVSFLLFLRMRSTAYVISYAGEAEALARATGQTQQRDITNKHVYERMNEESPAGGELRARIELYYDRLLRRVLDAYQMAKLMGETGEEMGQRIARAFPPKRRIKAQKRALKPVKAMEADRDGDIPEEFTKTLGTKDRELVTGYVDREAWDTAVQDYLDSDIPTNKIFGRGPKDVYDIDIGEKELEERYGWELEKEATEDFVSRVRDGQVAAAKENGVTDFMWISVIDEKTDDCCYWRDGLTSSQIEEELKGSHKDDECDAIVPPAHFNCRCTIAPVTKDFPEVKPVDYGEFEEWLETT